MKTTRSFSLLTFLLISGVAALSVAIYSANNEVAQTREMLKTQSEEMGFIVAGGSPDNPMLHLRRLGGYPPLSFAYRYKLPKQQPITLVYKVNIGSGVVDPETGFPPVVHNLVLSNNETQGTLVVSLVNRLAPRGVGWEIQTVDGQKRRRRRFADPKELNWVQTYMDAIPTDEFVSRHEAVQSFDANEVAILNRKDEFHPSALATIPDKLLQQRQTFMIWIEPVSVEPGTTIPVSAVVPTQQ